MRRRKQTKAISYIRVSTDKQGKSGVGFEGQNAAIQKYATLDGLVIVEEFSDVASGRGVHNLIRRPGLKQALELARDTGMPIIVSCPSRMSRKSDTVVKIIGDFGVTVISAADGKMCISVIIASEAAKHQREGELISQRTKTALASLQDKGVRLGNPTNLPEARRKAATQKKQNKNDKVREIAKVIDELGDQITTDRQLVDQLNHRGILTGARRLWTLPGIRRPARAARQMISERKRELEALKGNPLFGRFG